MSDETFLAKVQLPDGTIGKFEVPKGMSPADIEQNALQAYMAANKPVDSPLYEVKKPSMGQVLKQSAIKAVANPIDLIAGAPQTIQNVQEAAKDLYAGREIKNSIISTPMTNYLVKHGLITPENQPSTPAQRIADVATQVAAPSAIGGMGINKLARNEIGAIPSMTRAMGQGLVAGGTTEGLEALGVENPLVKFGVTGLATAGAAAPFAMRNKASAIAHEATSNLTNAQIQAADNLVKQSWQLGSPITPAEALSKVVGQNPLSSVQRVVENLPQSAEKMTGFMQQRPASNEQMVANALRQISPTTGGAEQKLQQTAQNAINKAEKMRTEAVEPFYENTKQKFNPAQTDVNALGTNPAIGDAINHVINDPYSGAKGLKPNSPQALIAAKQYLDAQYDKFSNPMAGSMDKAKAATAYKGSRLLDNYLAEQSPSYGQGRDIYKQVTNEVVSPLKEGRIGTVSVMGATPEATMKAQQNVLMPTNPLATSPKEIKDVVAILRKQDPNAVNQWVRQSLEGTFNEASQNIQSGPNQAGGAKFASLLRGNKQQSDNLRTLITETAGMQAYQGFEKVLDVLEAQGTRQAMGSQTAQNAQFQRQLSEGGPLAAGKLIFKPSEVANKYEEWQMGKNASKLADMLTSKDGVEKLKELARTKPTTAKAQTILNSIIGGAVSQKSEIKEESK